MCLLKNVPAEQLYTQCVLEYCQGQEAHSLSEPIQSLKVKFSFPETSALNTFFFSIFESLLIHLFAILKGYFPFTVVMKYCLYSLCCTIQP